MELQHVRLCDITLADLGWVGLAVRPALCPVCVLWNTLFLFVVALRSFTLRGSGMQLGVALYRIRLHGAPPPGLLLDLYSAINTDQLSLVWMVIDSPRSACDWPHPGREGSCRRGVRHIVK